MVGMWVMRLRSPAENPSAYSTPASIGLTVHAATPAQFEHAAWYSNKQGSCFNDLVRPASIIYIGKTWTSE